MSLVQ